VLTDLLSLNFSAYYELKDEQAQSSGEPDPEWSSVDQLKRNVTPLSPCGRGALRVATGMFEG
jgi:hypothetical protein